MYTPPSRQPVTPYTPALGDGAASFAVRTQPLDLAPKINFEMPHGAELVTSPWSAQSLYSAASRFGAEVQAATQKLFPLVPLPFLMAMDSQSTALGNLALGAAALTLVTLGGLHLRNRFSTTTQPTADITVFSREHFYDFVPTFFDKRDCGEDLHQFEREELKVADDGARLLWEIQTAAPENQAALVKQLFSGMEHHTNEGRRESYLTYMPKILAMREVLRTAPHLLGEPERNRLLVVMHRGVTNRFRNQLAQIRLALARPPAAD